MLKTSSKIFYTYFCVIFIVTFLSYYPSLFLFFAGLDIAKYFLETQKSNLRELMTNYLSWSVVAEYSRGDTYSFRPLGIMLLGLERYFFGARYILWQILHIIMHLGVVLCLYRLLLRIQRHIFAWLLCFLFSVYAIFARVITWANFGNYFLFLTLVLTALYHLYKYTFEREKARYSLFWVSLSMLLGCFLYETGVVYCLLFVTYLAILSFQEKSSRKKRDYAYLIILIPASVFLLAYSLNLYLGRSWLMAFEAKRILSFQNVLETITTIPKIFLLWVGRGFFLDYTGGRFTSSVFTLLIRYGMLIFSILYISVALGASRSSLKKNWLFMTLVFSMMIVHVAVNCFARMGTHGIDYMLATKHTNYMFWAFLITFVYSAVDFEKLKTYSRKIYYVGTIGLFMFILFNVVATYGINRIIAAEQKPVRLYTDQLYRFIEEHRREEDFSFAVASSIPWTYTLTQGYIDPKGEMVKGVDREFPVHEIYFGEYYSKKRPKYVLRYDLEKNEIKVRK